MFCALATSHFAASDKMLTPGTPSRYNRVQATVRRNDSALAERRVR